MRPQSCKAKGRRLQQLIANDLLKLHPHLTDDDVRSTSMGANGEDVQLSQAARAVLPYSFEAKNTERLNVWSALEQARANAPDGTDPIVVIKKNREKPHALVSWDLLLRLFGSGGRSVATPREQMLTLAAELQRMAAALPTEEGEESMADDD